MIKACKKGPGLDVVNPSTLADTPIPDPKKGILQQTKPTYTANPPDDQNKCMDSGEEVNSPEEGIYDVMHPDNINRNTTMIANDKPTRATNTDVIRHPQRKVAQGQTLILGIEDWESPKKRISTTHLWRKFSETINTLKAAATHRLTAATLSLSEGDGIGVLHAPPTLAVDKDREDHRGNFDRKPN